MGIMCLVSFIIIITVCLYNLVWFSVILCYHCLYT